MTNLEFYFLKEENDVLKAYLLTFLPNTIVFLFQLLGIILNVNKNILFKKKKFEKQ
jgi:hypothetical protein